MSENAKDCETQLAATRGFSLCLASELTKPSVENRELLEEILGALQIYETELARQIEGALGTKDWCTFLRIASSTVTDLRSELVEQKAELAGYNPLNEPMTIDEMIVRLLSVGPGIYGMWVEFGLKTKNYPAEPFMRPTFDSTKETAVTLFANTLKDVLEEIAKGR